MIAEGLSIYGLGSTKSKILAFGIPILETTYWMLTVFYPEYAAFFGRIDVCNSCFDDSTSATASYINVPHLRVLKHAVSCMPLVQSLNFPCTKTKTALDLRSGGHYGSTTHVTFLHYHYETTDESPVPLPPSDISWSVTNRPGHFFHHIKNEIAWSARITWFSTCRNCLSRVVYARSREMFMKLMCPRGFRLSTISRSMIISGRL
jgi:hypothetical protein